MITYLTLFVLTSMYCILNFHVFTIFLTFFFFVIEYNKNRCSSILFQTVHIFGCASVRKLAGFLSIHGHDLADREWQSVCSSGPQLVTLECHCVSCGWQSICLSTLLDKINSDENKLVIKEYMRTKRVKDIGCVLMLKSSGLTQKLQCQDSFELSTVLVSASYCIWNCQQMLCLHVHRRYCIPVLQYRYVMRVVSACYL